MTEEEEQKFEHFRNLVEHHGLKDFFRPGKLLRLRKTMDFPDYERDGVVMIVSMKQMWYDGKTPVLRVKLLVPTEKVREWWIDAPNIRRRTYYEWFEAFDEWLERAK